MELTGKHKRHLRRLGHHLEPCVQIGRHGITDAVVDTVVEALEARELIKVRFGPGFDDPIDEAAATLGRRGGAAVAGRIGRTALLYRARDVDPEIVLPGGTEAPR